MATGYQSNDLPQQSNNGNWLDAYINSSDFKTVSKSPAFIDKTMFIKKVLKSASAIIFITAPHGFGKSTNLNMLKRFIELNIDETTGRICSERDSINYKLFKKNRLISCEAGFIKKYFAKFAVIYISLKDVYGDNMDSLMETYTETLSKTFSEHRYLLKSDRITIRDKEIFSKYIRNDTKQTLSKSDLELGIAYLAKMLSKHCRDYKIFTLIDDYDAPFLKFINDDNITDEYEDQFLSFFRDFFRITLPDNGDTNRALITGTTTLGRLLLPYPTEPLTFNSLFATSKIYTTPFLWTHIFREYYGVTTYELDALTTNFNIDNSIKERIITNYGYTTAMPDKIVCTRSLMNYLNSKVFEDYFRETTNINLKTTQLARYIIEKTLFDTWYEFAKVKFDINSMTSLRQLFTRYSDNPIILTNNNCFPSYLHIQLLLELGFFNLKHEVSARYGSRIFIRAANKFIREELRNQIEKYYSMDLNQRLHIGAAHLNLLTIDSNSTDYFSQLSKIMKSICIGRADASYKSLYGPLIALIAKSEYYIDRDSLGQAEGFCFTNRVTGVICVINYNTEVKENLQIALNNPAFEETRFFCLKNKIYMGININEFHSFSFGVVINSREIENAVYYNF